METKILKSNEKKTIDYAVKLLLNGEIIAMPTDTVYGLGGICTNEKAIEEIFRVKNRPQDKPIILLLSDLEMLPKVVREFPQEAKILAEKFWPGAMTLILKKGNLACEKVTLGNDTIGVRIPNNKVIREIIRKTQIPLAVTSANISGKPSPTNANNVYSDLNNLIPLIVDDGECQIGEVSTIIEITDKIKILRQGAISKDDIEKVLNTKIEN